MARFTVRIKPKCIQFTSKASSIGKNTGPNIIVAEMISMNMPMIRSKIFIANKNMTGVSMVARTASVIFPGMLSRVSRRPKQVAQATIISNVAEVTAELTVIFLTSLNLTVL